MSSNVNTVGGAVRTVGGAVGAVGGAVGAVGGAVGAVGGAVGTVGELVPIVGSALAGPFALPLILGIGVIGVCGLGFYMVHKDRKGWGGMKCEDSGGFKVHVGFRLE